MRRPTKKQRGFTIIELTIATAVFSLVLLVLTIGAISLTHMYIKGANRSKTQEAARQVMDEVGQSVQFSSSVQEGSNGAWRVYCVDNVRYSYRINVRFTDSNPTATHALVRSPMTGSCVPKTTFSVTDGDVELLGNNMRLGSFSVTEGSNKNYAITTTVMYGEDDLFNAGNCITGSGSQYCAKASLSTLVQRRL